MTITRPVQIFFAAVTFAVAIGEFLFAVLMDDPPTNFHPIIPVLYIAFFWAFWVYARLVKPVSPLVKSSAVMVLGVLSFLFILVIFMYFSDRSESRDVSSFDRFMPMHAFLILGYSFISAVLFFGDSFLGPVACFLKFGRPFEIKK
jgi:hypothetical protein